MYNFFIKTWKGLILSNGLYVKSYLKAFLLFWIYMLSTSLELSIGGGGVYTHKKDRVSVRQNEV